MLANDMRFQKWCGVDDSEDAVEDAADFIRAQCGVRSRRGIEGNTKAESRFINLHEDYMMATGQWSAPR